MAKAWKVLREEKTMKDCTVFDWQEDNWTSINTEDDQVWDMNLYRDDITNKCRLVFYPTYINDEGIREVNTTGYAKCYKVIEEKS